MESKKKLQFNDDFEIFFFVLLSFTWSNRTPDKFSFISHFLVYHRERAREIVWLLAAPSVLETGNISSQWLSLGFPFCRVKYSLNLNYRKKLTHDKDSQWHQNYYCTASENIVQLLTNLLVGCGTHLGLVT
jgi:hypothetical protein